MASTTGPPLPSMLGCSTASAVVEGAALLQSCGLTAPKQRRWFSVLADVQPSTDTSSAPVYTVEALAHLLLEAQDSVQSDQQWNDCEIQVKLEGLLKLCLEGDTLNARKGAVPLLGFHTMVENYWRVMSQPKTQPKSDGNSGVLHCCETLEDAPRPPKRQRTGGLEEVSAAVEEINTTSDHHRSAEFAVPTHRRLAEFAVPRLPVKKSPQSAVHSHGSETAIVAAAPAPEEKKVVWRGCVQQSAPNGRNMVFCNVSMPLPAGCAAELAECGALEVTQLAQRRKMKLGRPGISCGCTLLEASAQQLATLKTLAQNEMVALVPLEGHGLILVPYLAKGDVRLMCLCLAPSPQSV